jgi:Lrp/AsnC family transcriptional regulator, regulator for asnA, asnC and gidA
MEQEYIEKSIDSLDKKIIALLNQDGRMSAGKIAKHLNITPPTVRSRIENLMNKGLLKIAGLINAFKADFLTIAIVGINLEMHQQLDEKIEQISNLKQVHWAVVVTGSYDIIVEVVLADGVRGLYRFLIEDLPKVGGIRSTESFTVMKAKHKWLLLRGEI